MFNKSEILEVIHQCAVSYYLELLNKVFIVKSTAFICKEEYVIVFEKKNFAHLTGMIAKGPRAIFFDKALNNTLTFNDFSYLSSRWIKYVKNKKLFNLKSISRFFANELIACEYFKNGKVECRLALSNGSYTLGFDGNDKLRVRTILDGDKITRNTKIYHPTITILLL